MADITPIVAAGLDASTAVAGLYQAAARRTAQAARIAQHRQQVALRQRIEERKLERERRRAEASARARMGASGMSSADGSGAAVLRGLNREFADRLADSRAVYDSALGGPNLLDDGSARARNIFGIGGNIVGILRDDGKKRGARAPNEGSYRNG